MSWTEAPSSPSSLRPSLQPHFDGTVDLLAENRLFHDSVAPPDQCMEADAEGAVFKHGNLRERRHAGRRQDRENYEPLFSLLLSDSNAL